MRPARNWIVLRINLRFLCRRYLGNTSAFTCRFSFNISLNSHNQLQRNPSPLTMIKSVQANFTLFKTTKHFLLFFFYNSCLKKRLTKEQRLKPSRRSRRRNISLKEEAWGRGIGCLDESFHRRNSEAGERFVASARQKQMERGTHRAFPVGSIW